MRILLTAFEPFDDSGLNASLEGCRVVQKHLGSPFDLHFAVLPVEYGPDVAATERALAEAGPVDVLLHTGQHGSAATVHVERLAINVRYVGSELPSVSSAQQLIDPDGPAAVFATIPVERVVEAIRRADVPAVLSNHGGIYLCNHALYQSVRRAERSAAHTRVGFLHVPRLPEQAEFGEPSMPAEETARAIHAALRSLSEE